MAFCRRGTHADVSSLLRLMQSFNSSEGIPWRAEVARLALERLINEPELGFVVTARRGPEDPIVGYGIGTFGYDLEFGGRDAFVTELFVLRPSRGQGIGRSLLRRLLLDLEREGARAVHLLVTPGNAAARSLYDAEGFRSSNRIFMTRRPSVHRSGTPE